MPEGHTIHRIALDHTRLLAGRAVAVTSPQGRFAADAARVDGAVLQSVEAYGKHLFYWWSTGDVGHVHLGLFGRFRTHHGEPRPPEGEVRMRMHAGDLTLDLAGPTACSVDDPSVRHSIVARLGPDPLRRDGRPGPMVERMHRSRQAMGALLLDQSVVAGIGNVYRAEALFAHGIHPARPGRDVEEPELTMLWTTLRIMLRAGLRAGRIITVDRREVSVPRGRPLRRGEATHVYHRDVCLRCGTPIRTVVLGARACYFCPTCQPV